MWDTMVLILWQWLVVVVCGGVEVCGYGFLVGVLPSSLFTKITYRVLWAGQLSCINRQGQVFVGWVVAAFHPLFFF